jgi:hypothetical protein
MQTSLIRYVLIFLSVFFLPLTIHSQDVTVGGHFELSLFDAAGGKSRIAKKKDTTSFDYAGFQFLRFIPFFKCQISEKISLDIRPMIELYSSSVDAVSSATPSSGANAQTTDATTGATPVFNRAIGDQRAKKAKVSLGNINKATVQITLPGSTELALGVLQPRFTWDYGQQLFWEDEIHGSMFTCNPWLADFSDVGLEIVKFFDIGDMSIPVYAYILNGSGFEKISQLPIGMIHVEPSIYPFRFHLSAGGGYWDFDSHAKEYRFAGGVSGAFGKFSFRSEAAYGKWEKRILATGEDAEPWGGYLKMYYRLHKVVRVSLGTSYVYSNFIRIWNPLPGQEQYVTITPAVQILTTSSSRIIVQCDINQWIQKPAAISDYLKVLEFGRLTIGWRFTF